MPSHWPALCLPGLSDRDHYDVAARWYEPLVAAGAVPVGPRELVRRLRAGGLRRTKQSVANEQQERISHLQQFWQGTRLNDDRLRSELLECWGSSSRRYHDQQHLWECLRAVELLWPDRPRTLDLAVWFHDAVHAGQPGRDEEESAQLAEQRLHPLLPPAEVAEVARLVRMTAPTPTRPDRSVGAGAE